MKTSQNQISHVRSTLQLSDDQLASGLNRFAINLKLFRIRGNLSQTALADQLGVSHRTYQRIENSDAEPSLSILMKLSTIFNLDICDMVNFEIAKSDIRVLPEQELSTNPEARDFYHLCQENLTDEYLGSDENQILKVSENEKFLNFKMPMTISNFAEYYVNQASVALFPNSLKIGHRYVTGHTYQDMNQIISVINFLHGKDKTLFIHSAIHQLGEQSYQMKFCGYYRYFGLNHLCCYILLDSKKI